MQDRKPTPSSSEDEALGKDETTTSSSSDEDCASGKDTGKTTEEAGSSSNSANKFTLDYIQHLIANKLGLHSDDESDAASPDDKILQSVDFKGVLDKWRSGGFKNVITMVGAGISTCKIVHSIMGFGVFVFLNLTLFYMSSIRNTRFSFTKNGTVQ